ncbi:MAG: RimK family alpha-L-glutamate ligase [Candidatus Margulisiibacteriota bacterium]|nr:MAG: glutathione synthase [Candidatus Margulisbacteria bacterium GWD2_39_127]OGI04358.1 MAG: glutathione synthase [Candidatus Margulisbacteria bacterium GWF2_38_17]PZM84835.1 MAG: RimK family alpha-L-glutamate ligase [Candidatus Margulisiibacteriota bacterium]HAR63292.1 RimK family alpha-L-glutamate ligase [Candidatus Margulisiibacteriota bacterium]HCY36361.1 RimK family alpha-L-glutamate ligase [Candidatus Margulisiibacteriota bacterium]
MQILVVVNNPKDWPIDIPGVVVISAREYLRKDDFSEFNRTRVFNLCRSYQYQSIGYYVSLLAAARAHKPLPEISNILDMNSQPVIRFISDELDQLIQKSLRHIKSTKFTISIYFARTVAKIYERLSVQLFYVFQAPLLRASFVCSNNKWHLQTIKPLSVSDIPEHHREFIVFAAREYFDNRRCNRPRREFYRYDIAILANSQEKDSPSNPKAMQKFLRAAKTVGLEPEIIGKNDLGRIAQFDALFIRETTKVNHHTYKFSRQAERDGLVLVDDPESILRCTNKVYLSELLKRHKINTPKTVILHNANVSPVKHQLGFPCVLKLPDSSFSLGVIKVDDEREFKEKVKLMLEESDMIIAQEFLPTTFDWRVGVLDRQPLYVCKYYMADKHWQIVKRTSSGRSIYGDFETLAVEDSPKEVVSIALKAANLIGDGLYGVDIKQIEGKLYVIEINDNPTIDSGVEDAVIKAEMYLKIMKVFLKRIEYRKHGLSGT